MRNFKMIISYDGSRYEGWQRQMRTENTIQGKIEKVLERCTESKEPLQLIGAGRTDGGVHALGQTANVHLKTDLTAEQLMEYLNRYLPDDIAVREVCEVEERFHSRFHARSKWYRYEVRTDSVPDVFRRKYQFSLEGKLQLEAMRQGAALLCGEHDFLAFSSLKKTKGKSTVRRVDSIEITEYDGTVIFDFRGEGFLYNMVRIMTGTLLEIGQGKRSPESIARIFAQGRREDAGFLVPGKGLCLMEVSYE